MSLLPASVLRQLDAERIARIAPGTEIANLSEFAVVEQRVTGSGADQRSTRLRAIITRALGKN
jgi:hypothetical protein